MSNLDMSVFVVKCQYLPIYIKKEVDMCREILINHSRKTWQSLWIDLHLSLANVRLCCYVIKKLHPKLCTPSLNGNKS